MPTECENESLGLWLRRRRKVLDLTQAALADRVGCAAVTIRRLEAGVQRPSRQMAERLATCLEIPADERAVFVQVVRGERRPDRLAPLLRPSEPIPRTSVEVPIARLPLEIVPPPAPLPPGSRMPLRRNPLFVGRDADLRQVAQALTVGGAAAIGQLGIAAATGLGGIGKTQLAAEFVHRYGQFFAGGVFWLSFADPAAVPAEVAACGGADAMQLRPAFGTLPLQEQVQRVLATWRSPLPRLLVFDNCEDEALLEAWRPAHGGCRMLVTSRRQHWDPALGVQPLPLDVLSRGESIVLLHQFRPDLPADDPDLAAIADTLGDLPLALHLAGSSLAKYRHALTPAQYLQRLQSPTILDDRSLQAAGLSPTRHVQHVARTFEQSYERLDADDSTDALALTLLAHAACCAPGEPIPRWFLLHTLDLPGVNAERTLQAEDALTRLLDLGLLDTDTTGHLRMHRLLVAFGQAVLGHDAAQAVEVTMLRVADDLNARRNPQPVLAVQPHLRFITEAARERADTRTAALCNALGYHLWQLGVYGEAQGYLEQALAIRQRMLGDDHPDTALSLNNLGLVLNDQGQFAAARDAYEQALAIRQRVVGPDHPDTAMSLQNLGLLFWEQGQYAAAQGYLEQALAIRQRMLGDDHPETAASLNNLGTVLNDQGRYTEAQGYAEQALAIWRRVLGPDHPHTAMGLNNVGRALHDQGQYAEAQGYLEQALAIWQRVLGENHPDTALSLNNLGVVFHAQGQYAEAQGYLEQVLEICQRVLGPDHPKTAQSLHNLGFVLQDQGQYAEAQGYYVQALAIKQRVLGPNHPDTALSLNNLGEVLKAQGYYAEAQGYFTQALAIFQRVLGLDHPKSAHSLNNLGRVLASRGRYVEGQLYCEQALAIRQRVLGDDHPDTANSLRGLGEVLHAQGDATQARRYLERALAIFEQRLGLQHPDTAESLHQLGLVLHIQGQDAEARHSLERALTIYEQALGAEHPSTQRVRASLAAILEHHRER